MLSEVHLLEGRIHVSQPPRLYTQHMVGGCLTPALAVHTASEILWLNVADHHLLGTCSFACSAEAYLQLAYAQPLDLRHCRSGAPA